MKNQLIYEKTLNPTILRVSIISGSENRTVEAVKQLDKELSHTISAARISKAFTGFCLNFLDIRENKIVISTDVGKIEPESSEEEDRLYTEEISEALEAVGFTKA